MKKYSVCILFGGVSPEHEVSLRSAESVLNNIDQEKYDVYPVGITREGQWIYFPGKDYSKLPAKTWSTCPGACPAVISPARGQGLLCFEGNTVTARPIDVVFPVLHGENGEDGAMQGLLQMAGIPYVGSHVSASAVAMDKTLTKLVIDKEGIPQAAWELVRARDLARNGERILDALEARFAYPMFVKPAGTGSSVGVSKAADRQALRQALAAAAKFDEKVLVEEFIRGKE
ncbi:MAG TPA: D-alanine--D-alanine ligase A, partial [Clostridiales bacterium]|nr:D-alanine--D-alanine ligase A [Clostridiales bacterium]